MRRFSYVLSLLIIILCCGPVATAQNNSRKIVLTPMASDALELPSAAKNSLQQKLTQMALQNGMAAQDGDFVLTASYTVLDDLVAPTDVAQYVVKIEVMFYVVNLIEDLIMAENSCIVKGNGPSRDKAFQKAFNAINPRSPEALELINSAKDNIVAYYADRSEVLMGKANSFAKAGQYSDALAVLDPIPDCVPAYKEISALKDEIFAKWIDTEAESYLAEAKRCIAMGYYEDAFNAILSVNPLSSKFKDAEALSKEIDKRIIAAEKAEADAIARQQNAAVAIAQAASAAKIKEKEAEIAQANAVKEAAKAATAQANANEAQANANAANAQAAISQSQLQTLKTLKGKMTKLSADAQKAIVDNAFKTETQYTYVSQTVATVKPQQTMQEKTEALKKFLLGKMYKA